MDALQATESLQSVRDEFLIRFYRWATESSKKEADADFPRLRQIKNLNVERFLEFVKKLNRADRDSLCIGLVKKFHQRAVELLNEFPLPPEEALLLRYFSTSEISPAQLVRTTQKSQLQELRKELRSRFALILGSRVKYGVTPRALRFESQVGCWKVITDIDTGGRRCLGYSHSIIAHEGVFLCDGISILNLMGISSQTDWNYLSRSEGTVALKCLEDVCKEFLGAVPMLLTDLSHKLPEPDVREWKELVTVEGHRKNGFTRVVLDSLELRKAFAKRADWEIPTSIIPESLRPVGSRFLVVQDSTFSNESTDPRVQNPTYRHLRVAPL